MEIVGPVELYGRPLSLKPLRTFCRSDNERGPLNATDDAVRRTLAVLMFLFLFCLQLLIPCHARRSIADWIHDYTLGSCME